MLESQVMSDVSGVSGVSGRMVALEPGVEPGLDSGERATREREDGAEAGLGVDMGGDMGVEPGVDREGITALVHDLYAGRIRAEDLSLADRQRCVDHLTFDGFSNSEIADLMKISERTVSRDRVAIRRDHAVEPDRHLGDELLGEFHRIILASVQRLVRLCRDPQAPAYARLWAEESIARNYQRLIDTARKLHYFEDGTRRLADQRLSDPAEFDRVRRQGKAERALVKAHMGMGDDLMTSALAQLMGLNGGGTGRKRPD